MITIGSFIGRYKVLSILGKGGMGFVLRARSDVSERDVAVKVLLAEKNASEELHLAAQRLRDEACAAGNIEHPCLVKLLDVGNDDKWGIYLVYELCVGGSLDKQFSKGSPPKLDEVISKIAKPLLCGLAALHENGIVHRDIKPENLFLDEKGRCRIGDLGLAFFDDRAARTRTGVIVGTPGYMAPERFSLSCDSPSHSVDVYAAALVIAEAASGRRVFADRGIAEIIRCQMDSQWTNEQLLRLGVPSRLIGPLVRALAKDPKERTNKATELLKELQAALSQVRPLKEPEKNASVRPQKKWSIKVFVLLFITLLCIPIFFLTKNNNPDTLVELLSHVDGMAPDRGRLEPLLSALSNLQREELSRLSHHPWKSVWITKLIELNMRNKSSSRRTIGRVYDELIRSCQSSTGIEAILTESLLLRWFANRMMSSGKLSEETALCAALERHERREVALRSSNVGRAMAHHLFLLRLAEINDDQTKAVLSSLMAIEPQPGPIKDDIVFTRNQLRTTLSLPSSGDTTEASHKMLRQAQKKFDDFEDACEDLGGILGRSAVRLQSDKRDELRRMFLSTHPLYRRGTWGLFAAVSLGNRDLEFTSKLADGLVELAKDRSSIGSGGELSSVLNEYPKWEPEFDQNRCLKRSVELVRVLFALKPDNMWNLEYNLYEIVRSLGDNLRVGNAKISKDYLKLVKELREKHLCAFILVCTKRTPPHDTSILSDGELTETMKRLLATPPTKRTLLWVETVHRVAEVRWARMLAKPNETKLRTNEVDLLTSAMRNLSPGVSRRSEGFNDTMTLLNLHHGDLLLREQKTLPGELLNRLNVYAKKPLRYPGPAARRLLRGQLLRPEDGRPN